MSRLIFNNQANLGQDNHYMNCLNKQNEAINNYTFANFHTNPQFINQPGVFRDAEIAVQQNDINTYNKLLSSERLTNFGCKTDKQLDTRVYITMPFTGAGSSSGSVDVESKLHHPVMDRFQRSCDQYEQRDTMIPLLSNIQNGIQNVDHFVESKWVRGGMSTRSIKQNMHYVKCYGKSK